MTVCVVRLAGAPASGKTWLRHKLGDALSVPTFGIDEERLKLMGHGERWPEDDRVAWVNLRAAMLGQSLSVVETSGLTTRDCVLFAGCRLFTILCIAPNGVRLARLIQRTRQGYRFSKQHNYVRRLMAIGTPSIKADHVWNSDTDLPHLGGLSALVEQIRAWSEME